MPIHKRQRDEKYSPFNWTETMYERKRYWKDGGKLTERLNAPIQGSSADITKKALVLLDRKLSGTPAKIIHTVHDEIILEVPKAMAEEYKEILREEMVEAGESLLKKVPVVVDVKIGDSWAEK